MLKIIPLIVKLRMAQSQTIKKDAFTLMEMGLMVSLVARGNILQIHRKFGA